MWEAAQHGPWCGSRTWRTRCPTCRVDVFFFSCRCGCKVFFDGLKEEGWPKHVCEPDPRDRSGMPVSSTGRKASVTELAKRRGLDVLLHFTDARNLASISERGLIGRRYLEEAGQPYFYADPERLDGMLDCLCFSVEHPDHVAMQAGVHDATDRGRAHSGEWVVLEIRLDVLRQRDAWFFPRNSGERKMRPYRSHETPPSVGEDFEAMFDDKLDYREPGLLPAEPTNPRAEVLVRGPIPTSRFQRIHVPDERALRRIQDLANFPVVVTPELFDPRHDQVDAG